MTPPDRIPELRTAPTAPLRSTEGSISLILVGCTLMFLVLQVGTNWLAVGLDRTWSAVIASAVMICVALALEKLFFNRSLSNALSVLGWRRPDPSALLVAAIVALPMLAFLPLFALATGAQVALKSDWWWILVGAVALNGIAEETLFRGYVFGGLRQISLSFSRAGLLSLAIFAAVHLLLFLENPFIIGLLGLLVAIAMAFPMAYLFERGNHAIWAPVILHVAAHTIRLVEISEPYALTALAVWMLLQITLPFLVFAFQGNLLTRSAR